MELFAKVGVVPHIGSVCGLSDKDLGSQGRIVVPSIVRPAFRAV